MNKTTITRFANRSVLYLKKYSPQILLGIGGVSFGATVVLASKETLQLQPILDDHKFFMEHHQEQYEEGTIDRKEFGKNNLAVYTSTSKRLMKLYAPAVTLGVLSVSCFLGAHEIVRRRNVALVAAYNTLDTVYNRYREEVASKYGEDEDRELLSKAVANPEVTPAEDREVGGNSVDRLKVSQYAKYFDWNSSLWKSDSESNLTFLRYAQQFMNDLLCSRGHVFLNDVYDELDIPRTTAGAVVGWVYEEGDGYIDLGIYTDENAPAINGEKESRFLLDPNVQGVIYDRLGK